MYRVCWLRDNGMIYRCIEETLEMARFHAGGWNNRYPHVHHWIESVDDPNVLVEAKS